MNTLLTACRPTTDRGVRSQESGVRILAAALVVFPLCAVVWAQDRSVWDGVYTADQAKRGAALYANECALCHGTDLTGGESAPPLYGGEFTSNWNGLTVGDLFERIRTTMPASQPGKLNRDQNTEILAFMLSVNQFPAGSTALARQTEALKQIRFESARPEGKK